MQKKTRFEIEVISENTTVTEEQFKEAVRAHLFTLEGAQLNCSGDSLQLVTIIGVNVWTAK